MNRVICVQTRNQQVRPPQIYFAPGERLSDGAMVCDLYSYNPATEATPQLVCTIGPDAVSGYPERIYGIWYWLRTGLVYISTGVNTFQHGEQRIYAMAPGGTPSLLASWSLALHGVYSQDSFNYISAACEFGGSLYLSGVSAGASGDADTYLYRLDDNHTVTTVLDLYAPTYGANLWGGIGTDGTYLYWTNGTVVWASTDGASWSAVYDGAGSIDLITGFTSDPVAGVVYAGAEAMDGSNDALILKMEDGAVTIDGTIPTSGSAYGTGFAVVRYLASNGDATRSGPYAVGAYNTDSGLVQAMLDDTWTALDPVPDSLCNQRLLQQQGVVSYDGAFYGLFLSLSGSTYTMRFASGDAAGIWTEIASYSGVQGWFGGMAVVNTTRPPQEL